jgi:hypothetical protein
MGQKWSKAQHKKYSATMKAKREENHLPTIVTYNGPEIKVVVPPSVEMVLEKWQKEANEAFLALPFYKKAFLLAQVKQ